MKLEIAEFVCHRVVVDVADYGSTHLRLTTSSGGDIWYVSTRSGFEMVSDKRADELEAAFKQQFETKGTLQ